MIFGNYSAPLEFCSLARREKHRIRSIWVICEDSSIAATPLEGKRRGVLSSYDIWEVRVQAGNNIFRLLGFLDAGSLVILNHAFQKKTQKTPKKEINIAETRKQDYFNRRLS